MIEHRAVRNRKDIPGGYTDVVSSLLVLSSGRMLSVDHGSRYISELDCSPEIHTNGFGLIDSLLRDVICQLVNRHHGGSMLLRDRDNIGNVIAVTMSEQDIVDSRGQVKLLRVLWIVLNKRIDQNIGALGGLYQNGGMSQPGDTRSLE